MKVFVTGAGGYFGSNLVLELCKIPFITGITCLVHNEQKLLTLTNSFPQKDKIHFLKGDILDEQSYAYPLKEADVVIHTAALRDIETCENHPEKAIKVNLLGTQKILEATLHGETTHFIYASTQAVYGSYSRTPLTEDTPPCPQNIYALTKYGGELLVQKIKERGRNFLILRLSRLYGKGLFMREKELPYKFARLACQAKPLPIYGKGSDVIDLLHIKDAISALIFFLRNLERRKVWNQVYNVGGNNPIDILSFARTYQRVCTQEGLQAPEINFIPTQKSKPIHLALSIEKIRKTGWQPLVSLEEGIRELIRQYRNELSEP